MDAARGPTFFGSLAVLNRRRTLGKRRNRDEDYNRIHDEASLLKAAEAGDVPTVRLLLQTSPDLRFTATDELGRTPLQLAVISEHEEIVDLLLDKYSAPEIYAALLQAISRDKIVIAETILRHQAYDQVIKQQRKLGQSGEGFLAALNGGREFGSDVTPLIMAAQRNQFEIVQLLLSKGETIIVPHRNDCRCTDCENSNKMDQLKVARSRLETYRGLASEAYISLSAKDPILTAFDLGAELKEVSSDEKHFKNQYMELADNLSHFVVKLLDHVSTNDELEIILNKTGTENEEKYAKLERLHLAIKRKEKMFVAHPSCQKKLVSIWYGDYRKFEHFNIVVKFLLLFLFALFYPVFVILYWLAPKTKVGRFISTPFMKFIAATASFIEFLLLLLFITFIVRTRSQFAITADSPYQDERDFLTQYQAYLNSTGQPTVTRIVRRRGGVIELLLMLPVTVWVFGLLWQECKQLYYAGIVAYFKAWYNFMDVAMLMLFISSLVLYFITEILLVMHGNEVVYDRWPEFFNDLAGKNGVDHQSKARYFMYWVSADRHDWDTFDPTIISEGLFAIAIVLSFSRVSYLLPASETLGPMQISLGRIIGSVLKFMAIFALVFIAFFIGLMNMYWYYSIPHRKMVDTKPYTPDANASKYFGGIVETLRTMFWALFGQGDYNVVEITTSYIQLDYTESIGYILYGTYNIATVIVLLNMFIAMMTESFETVAEGIDTEWKFSRACLYMDYIQPGTTLAVPFNLIPSPKSWFYFLRFICCLACRKRRKRKREEKRAKKNKQMLDFYMNKHAGAALRRTSGQMEATPGGEEENHKTQGETMYEAVTRNIVKRFIFQKQREADVEEGEIDEIKMDIGSLRYELMTQLTDQRHQIEAIDQRLDHLGGTVENIYGRSRGQRH